MSEDTYQPSPGASPSLFDRAARKIRCVIQYDRRAWDRLRRQMVAEDRWVYRRLRSWFRREG